MSHFVNVSFKSHLQVGKDQAGLYLSSLTTDFIAPTHNEGMFSKTSLKRPLKKDKTKILMTNGSLMKVESIAECSPWSILQYF